MIYEMRFPTSVGDVQLRALEPQIFFHARDIGIVQIGSVQIVDSVHQTAER